MTWMVSLFHNGRSIVVDFFLSTARPISVARRSSLLHRPQQGVRAVWITGCSFV